MSGKKLYLCSVWNFAKDFTGFMDHYNHTNDPFLRENARLPVCEKPPTLPIEIRRYLIFLCRCFRSSFQELFAGLLDLETMTDERYMRFCIPRCYALCSMQDSMSLMIACAFISELNFYILKKGRRRLVYASWKSFLSVFKRRYHIRFNLASDWERLSWLCTEKSNKQVMSTFQTITELDVTHLLQYSFQNNPELCNKYVHVPIGWCRNLSLYPSLNEYERILLNCDIEKTINETIGPRCEMCCGSCIEYIYNHGIIVDQMLGNRKSLEELYK